jgi:hypothetical protein
VATRYDATRHASHCKFRTVKGGEHQAHGVAADSPIVDPTNQTPPGQVGLDAERLAPRNDGAKLLEDEAAAATSTAPGGCPSSRSRAVITSLFKKRVPAGTREALDVVLPAPFGPARIRASGGFTFSQDYVDASVGTLPYTSTRHIGSVPAGQRTDESDSLVVMPPISLY